MIDKIKTYIIIGLAIALVGVTLFFTMGKGIQIDKSTHMTTHQHQEQFQGQISMNFWMSQGNKVVWKCPTVEPSELANHLINLPPQYSYFSKIAYSSREYNLIVCTPEFMVETKK